MYWALVADTQEDPPPSPSGIVGSDRPGVGSLPEVGSAGQHFSQFDDHGICNAEIRQEDNLVNLGTNVKSQEEFQKWKELFCLRTNTCFNFYELYPVGVRNLFVRLGKNAVGLWVGVMGSERRSSVGMCDFDKKKSV
ncbi:hypothetical protein E2C01_011492 [Portunus trituberculatus]|uniref:Uncharacterized protein n=1 Tax=Portunus trituberculatus TaxID=210409 RepID=A0A5B7DB82_PORTR|nr:hypothetical protein [Portunus trituberculatus]